MKSISIGSSETLVKTASGLYCPAGGFFIDPIRPVEKAVITHAHSDHARYGSSFYLSTPSSERILRERLGRNINLQTLPFGQRLRMGEVALSFHPAAHVLGSAQIRLDHRGHITVVTGDYKTQPDDSCEAFEPLRAHTLVTECTFGLPVFRWPSSTAIRQEILDWWQENQNQGVTSVLFVYALGKAQRVLSLLQSASQGFIGVHGSIAKLNEHYLTEGISLAKNQYLTRDFVPEAKGSGLVLAPGSTRGTPWLRKLAPFSLGFASGWMQVRGNRRRRAVDRGFILSDHVDWPALTGYIKESGAECVATTHGFCDVVARWAREQGVNAVSLE